MAGGETGAMSAGWVQAQFPDPLVELLYGLQQSRTLGDVQAAYLKGIAGVVQADAHGVYQLDLTAGLPLSVSTTGTTDAFLQDYERCGRLPDPVLRQVMLAGEPAHSGLVLPRRAWRANPCYD
ncbi:MAG: hypothetical protein ACYDAG_11930, partial [Chloroflexota bacterium]